MFLKVRRYTEKNIDFCLKILYLATNVIHVHRGLMAREDSKSWMTQQAVLRLLMQFKQFDDVQIANMVGCTPGLVAQVRKSPMARRQIELVQATAEKNALDVQERLNSMSQMAVDVLESVLSSGSAETKDRIKVALGVLDRSGYSPKKELTVRHDYLSANLEALRVRAEMVTSNQSIEEVEVESIEDAE